MPFFKIDIFSHLAKCASILLMALPELNRYQAQARVLKALAHPARLLLVEALSQRERCVCELTALVGSDISTISKHLSLLKHAGIVEDDKRGAQVFYRLKTPCVMNFFKCVAAVRETQGAGGAPPTRSKMCRRIGGGK